jgi:hypothetical protein
MISETMLFMENLSITNKIIGTDMNSFIINLVLAVVVLVIGIVVGKIIKMILQKISDKLKLQQNIRPSFIRLILFVVEITIYILFITLALKQVQIPLLTDWIISSLVLIPAIVGSLVLITVGFVLAVYLRNVIEEAQVSRGKELGMILFYFLTYIFIVFALKTAFINFNQQTVDIIVIILTAIIGFAIALWNTKRNQAENSK